MKEDVRELGAVQDAVAMAQTMTELGELQLALVGGGFGEVVLV